MALTLPGHTLTRCELRTMPSSTSSAFPHATRPYFDTLRGSKFPNLREIIVTKKEQRVIYIFDPHQQAVLLLGGDKSQDYDGWYDEHIPEAEAVYREYLEATDRTPYEEE
jgi:hypothetical protein